MLDRPNFGRAVWFILSLKKTRPLSYYFAVFWGLAGLFGVEAIVPSMALATHELDHRFTVAGYVRDKEGRPVGDIRVHVRDLRDQQVEAVTTYTDGSGYYKAILHLHNDNAGDPIQVTVKDEKAGLDETKKIRAEFDPSDRKTERQARVDIGPVPEQTEDGWLKKATGAEGPNYWVYGVGGLLVSGAIGAAIAWSRRRQVKTHPRRRGKKR
jgi:hypothetical protein